MDLGLIRRKPVREQAKPFIIRLEASQGARLPRPASQPSSSTCLPGLCNCIPNFLFGFSVSGTWLWWLRRRMRAGKA